MKKTTITVRMMLLAMSLTFSGYANTTTAAKLAIRTELAEKQTEPRENAPAPADRERVPQLISPICNGYCHVATPWQFFLSFFGWA